eukprot:9544260-Karenia_brevis.AAC.1
MGILIRRGNRDKRRESRQEKGSNTGKGIHPGVKTGVCALRLASRAGGPGLGRPEADHRQMVGGGAGGTPQGCSPGGGA